MARFNYVALDARGQEATGLLEAASNSAAISQLRQAGYFPTSVIEEAIISSDGKESRRRAVTVARTTKPRAKKGIVLFQRRKVKSKILMIFTRQLATLIDSGLPLLRSLNVLAKQERDKLMKRTIDKLADSVQSGSTFSDALAMHPKIFNDLFVNMPRGRKISCPFNNASCGRKRRKDALAGTQAAGLCSVRIRRSQIIRESNHLAKSFNFSHHFLNGLVLVWQHQVAPDIGERPKDKLP